jgi:hypothetical protein
MDTLTQYREAIKQVIKGHADPTNYADVREELIFDESQDHYELALNGWEGLNRIDGVVIHIDIIDGKIWIQHDGTEYGVARELEELGIPRQSIVLAFHSPVKRPYTGYAVG